MTYRNTLLRMMLSERDYREDAQRRRKTIDIHRHDGLDQEIDRLIKTTNRKRIKQKRKNE